MFILTSPDVTDLIAYNLILLNQHDLQHSFFFLSEKDPEKGFSFDGTTVSGCIEGAYQEGINHEDPQHLRLMLASHLAYFLRTRLEDDFGYTSTCGISTNKVLSKLAGAKNKPRNQTTLLTSGEEDIVAFMDGHKLRNVPGIGFKAASLLESHVTRQKFDHGIDSHSFEGSISVAQARTCSSVTPALLETLLGGPGAEKGVGSRIWGLLHGVDTSEVKKPNNVPSQISIEDTYKGLETMPQITEELHKLAYSLIRRMRVDLVIEDEDMAEGNMHLRKWLARPRTLRLAIRSWPLSGAPQNQSSYSRISRSGPLPSFVFDLEGEMENLAERLLSESLLPLLRRLEPEKGPRWNLQLINICVANMVQGATNDKHGAGRDIANMFKHQDEALRPWKVVEEPAAEHFNHASDLASSDENDDSQWETTDNDVCSVCHSSIPAFAMLAHVRFHEMGE